MIRKKKLFAWAPKQIKRICTDFKKYPTDREFWA